jgi:uncharacterized phage protein gp47/JayE
MAYDLPSRDDLFREYLDAYPTTKNKSRGSEPWRQGRSLSALAWSVVARLIDFDRQRLPDKATGVNLQRWGSTYKYPKRGPTSAQGVLALRVFGTPGAPVTPAPQNAELVHADGTLYAITLGGAIIGGAGYVDVDLAALSTGAATNKVKNEQLTFTTPAANINAQATLVKDLAGGNDNEGDEEYRPRLLDRIGDAPQGGAYADFIDWCRKIPTLAIQDVYVYAHRRGLGTIDVAVLALGVGSGRFIADLTTVTNAIEAKRPGNLKDYKVLTVVETKIDVTAEIESADPKTYKWDWDDLGVGYVITAFDAIAKTITVPTAPASIVVGARLTVRGEEAKVTARAGNVLTLSFAAPATWFSFGLNAGVDTIRASGDLVIPARNAIIAQFGRLGPSRGSYAATPWEDTLRIAKLLGAVVPTLTRQTDGSLLPSGVTGVKDMTLITPVANQTPTDPVETNDAQINLLTPGTIIVRKKP